MDRWLAAMTSAKQLLWLLVLATVSGLILLVPVGFLPAGAVPIVLERAVRGVHSVSSLLLVVASLAHAVRRALPKGVVIRAILSGYGSSAAIAVAAMSGAWLADPGRWAAIVGVDVPSFVHALSVFHYGYSAALSFAVVYWHVRLRTTGPFWLFDWTVAESLAFFSLTGVLIGVASSDDALLTTKLLAPGTSVLAAWTLMAPAIVVLGWAGRRWLATRPASGPGA